MKKDEYPLAIAEFLSIPAQEGVGGPWMSNEGTVLSDWLKAVGEALDIQYVGEKVRMMQRLVEAVGKTWDPVTMSSKITSSEGGGNISAPAFAAFYDGLLKQGNAQARRDANTGRGNFTSPKTPSREDDKKVLRAIGARRGQPSFRATLLRAYGAKCAVTDCDAPAALEAAHIVPYGQGGNYDPSNGLLLRADLHTLFDLRLLSFDHSAPHGVALHPELSGTAYEAALAGRVLRLPAPRFRPDPEALRRHRRNCDF